MSKVITDHTLQKMALDLSGLMQSIQNKANAISSSTGFSLSRGNLVKDIGVGNASKFQIKANPMKKSFYVGFKKNIGV